MTDSISRDSADGYNNAKSDVASSATSCDSFDPVLAEVVAAWPGLPEAVRAGIVAMVHAANV